MQGQYLLTEISEDLIKCEQKLSTFGQIFGSAQIVIPETFDLIFQSNLELKLIYMLRPIHKITHFVK